MSDTFMPDAPSTNKNTKTYAIIAVAVVALVLVLASQLNKQETTQTDTQEQMMGVREQGNTATGIVESQNRKDGTYEVMGNYLSPGGPEQIAVKITLQNNLITDAEVVPQAVNPNSVKFQGIFTENYKAMVVGKNINELQLDKVSGSSLTPKGFNDALQKVKAAAS